MGWGGERDGDVRINSSVNQNIKKYFVLLFFLFVFFNCTNSVVVLVLY